jgi:hypothetical protein
MIIFKPLKYCSLNEWEYKNYLEIEPYLNTYYISLFQDNKPYYLASPSIVSINFPRMMSPSVIITCSLVNVNNTSVYSFSLTEQQSSLILSGTCYLTINENSVIKKSTIEHIVVKK